MITDILGRYTVLSTEWEAIEFHACSVGIDEATERTQLCIEEQMDRLYPLLPAEVRDAWEHGRPTPQ